MMTKYTKLGVKIFSKFLGVKIVNFRKIRVQNVQFSKLNDFATRQYEIMPATSI